MSTPASSQGLQVFSRPPSRSWRGPSTPLRPGARTGGTPAPGCAPRPDRRRPDLPGNGPERIVPDVPITPTAPPRVRARAVRTPGLITPSTGTGMVSRRCSSAKALAVLQATTTIFTPSSTSRPASWRGEGAHRLFTLGAVGHAGGVAEIDDVLAGQEFMQGAQHGQPAHTRIEDPDGTGRCPVTSRHLQPPAGIEGPDHVQVPGQRFHLGALDEDHAAARARENSGPPCAGSKSGWPPRPRCRPDVRSPVPG